MRTVKALAAAAVIAAVAATPAAAADRGLMSSDVPGGKIEHGVYTMRTSGVPAGREIDQRTEYWATADRFRTRTTDAHTGALRAESIFDGRETVSYAVGTDKVFRYKGHEPFPGPGWPSAYNRKLVDCGVLEQVGERTVAGLPGVVYRVRQDRKTTDRNAGECAWRTDSPESQTELVFEAGTLRPLVRSHALENNGEPGRTFRQVETLVSRETRPAAGALAARLSKAAKRRAVRAWRAKAARKR